MLSQAFFFIFFAIFDDFFTKFFYEEWPCWTRLLTLFSGYSDGYIPENLMSGMPELSLDHITTKPNLVWSYYVYFALLSLFLGNPIQIGPIDNNKSPLSSPVLTKKLENTLDRIEDAFKSLPDRPRSASIGNMKKYNSPDLSSPRTRYTFSVKSQHS